MKHHDFYPVIQTLKAGWFELLLARFFGERLEVVDTVGIKTTHCKFRGKIYFLSYEDTNSK